MKYNIVLIALLILFFGLNYLEAYSFYSIPFTVIWKIPIIIYLHLYLFQYLRDAKIDVLLFIGYLFTISMTINTHFSGVVYGFSESIKVLIIPLVILYIIKQKKISTENIELFAVILASYLCLINVPYLLGIIESQYGDTISRSYMTSGYNFGFLGAYNTLHSNSVNMGISLLILIFFVSRQTLKKVYSWIPLLGLIAGGFSLVLAFVRTGWVLFVIAFLLYTIQKLKHRINLRNIIYISIFIGFIIAIISTDNVISKRVFDQRIDNKNKTFIEVAGSGRILFIYSTVEIWKDLNAVEKIFGIGRDQFIEKMSNKVGMDITSHNGFLDILVMGGGMSLLLWLLVLAKIYAIIFRYNSRYKSLLLSIFIAWLSVGLVQGFYFIYFNLFLSLLLSLHIRNRSYA